MARFYGIVQGNRGSVTRMGSKASGLRTTAASWDGAVEVRVWYNAEHDMDWATVTLGPWHNNRPVTVLYSGPIVPNPNPNQPDEETNA